jgi:hypothetical protein
MTASPDRNFERAFSRLEELGLLLVSGTEIPDVRRLISDKESKGSWWADPAAQQIFNVNENLEDHPDVVVTKLVSRKVTFVHRKLWNYLFVVATARVAWQLQGLSKAAVALLNEVDKNGSIRTDKFTSNRINKPGEVARELEQRLLVHSAQFHTESGAHARVIETWEAWAKRAKLKPKIIPVETARGFLENRLDDINHKYSGRGKLPWQ